MQHCAPIVTGEIKGLKDLQENVGHTVSVL